MPRDLHSIDLIIGNILTHSALALCLIECTILEDIPNNEV